MNPGKYNRNSQFRYQQYSSGSQQQNSYSQRYSPSNLNKHYEVLESKPTDSLATIKSNYRRLIKEYHYDSLASKDLSDKIIKLAEIKTQELNEAYAIIKKEKKED